MVLKLSSRLLHLGDGPFDQLNKLLSSINPEGNKNIIDLSLGEPHHVFPRTVASIISKRESEWGKYPPLRGSQEMKDAVVGWLGRRYSLPAGLIDADKHVLALSGTREGLFLIAQVAVESTLGQRGFLPKVLMPNPYYAAYPGAAAGAGAEAIFVPATSETKNLPDYESLPPEILSQVKLCYLCSPSNPQGSVADTNYLKTLISLARKHGFVLAVDECYGELYNSVPPPGALEVCAGMDGGSLENVVVFHTLSKRSSVPGLRSGFVCGDSKIISEFARLRAYSAATAPGPILAASAALWSDDKHVEDARLNYQARFDQSERVLSRKLSFQRPDAAFYLWLEVGDAETMTRKLWTDAALKVMPGSYLSHGIGGENPGRKFIRVALVEDEETTEDALERIAKML